MIKRAAFFCCLLLALCACSKSTYYVDWLYESMPLPDNLQYPRSFWEENVAKTLEVRKSMDWGIPEREFRHFVLPLRVNNETLDDFRTVYADTLCNRVRGMSLEEAALEINHWCHEQACYEPSDGRTSAPVATVRRGVGRCGEESVLTVAALRAAGIPARQVYTPRWAHTDDNHAWVEVWTGDGWHFMGACEPAPTLDNAWFNAPVSRAMLLHTKVYGDYDGPEDVIQRTPCYTEINVIRNYVPARNTVVTVLDGDTPVKGATVEFKIYNYAEFYTVATYTTGADGSASLHTGLGDLLVWARKGNRFGFAKADAESVTVRLEHEFGERFCADVDIVPPPENPIPTNSTPEMEEANKLRLAEEDAIRNSHPHNNPDADSFLERHGEKGRKLLDMISAKDRGDVSLDVLEDALLVKSEHQYILSPRVELEPLRPFRAAVMASDISSRLHNAREVENWVRDSIKIVDGRNPQNLRTAPAAVWEARRADTTGRNIFFVALCRALGFPARIDPVTGKAQYAVREESAGEEAPVMSTLNLLTPLSSKPEYYKQYTITRLGPEKDRLMEFDENAPFTLSYELECGYYLLTSGTRLQDGSVLAHMEFFTLPEGETAGAPLVFRQQEGKCSVIGGFDANSLLDASGRGMFLLAILGSRGDEPTNHALRELETAAPALNAWGRPLVVIGNVCPKGTDTVAMLPEADEDLIASLSATGTPGFKLPVIALCDSFGRIYYISKGYNTSLANDLKQIIQ